MDTQANQTSLDLNCPTCGNKLTMTDKGLSCPVCDLSKKLVIKKDWFGLWRVIEAKNVFCSGYLTSVQCEDLTKHGVDIHVIY